MKNIISTLLILQALISNAQIPSKYEIVEIRECKQTTDSLVDLIDKQNPNKLVRKADLDSAAKHHANYLVLHYFNAKELTHREKVDYPNFTEKEKPGDRTGYANKTSEICLIGTESSYVHKRLLDKDFREKTGRKGEYHEMFYDKFPARRLFKEYKESPEHWEIINTKNLESVGSYSLICIFKITEGLSPEDIHDGDVFMVAIIINVTVFVSKAQ
jgi:hypothetical protein